MAKKEILVAYGVHVDAVAGWLGSYGGEDSPDDISRGMFAGEVGIPRMLKFFKKYNIPASWFIPGHSIETFPEQMKMIVEAGHEIGLHGYSHENPVAMTPQQEEAVLVKCIGLIEQLTGKRVVLVSNLKPATLCGVESCGMILAADDIGADGEESVKVLFVDGVAPGSRVR